MNKKRKKISLITGIALAAAILVVWLCYAAAGPTRVAMVNFPRYQMARMAKSLDNNSVKLESVELEQFGKLKNYDAVLIFGMGIRMTDDHRAVLEKLKAKGVPIYSTSVTDPANNITSLDSTQRETVKAYLGNGGTKNYRSLFNWIRRDLDGKSLFTGAIEPPVEISGDVLFHLDDEQTFATVGEFDAYYRKNGFYKEQGPKVALLVGMAGPFDTNKEHLDSLIRNLEARGMNVYPVSSFAERLELLQEISPDAVIYMPHGRMLMGQGERGVEWLKERNIPVICPITINDTYDHWMADKQGMVGGFLSQSVVMPELDGGIVPMAINAQFIDDEGLYLFKAIPGRAEQFAGTVANYLKLRTKANKDKKIAIYYFKGPGSNSLVAAGLEVLPSLYHFLKKLQSEGYDLSGLPASEKEFEKAVMERGPVFNSYAEGNIGRYLRSGYPELIPTAEYDGWLHEALRPEQYAELTAKHGAAPGGFYTAGDSIAVTRIRFGNVALLPQPTQGTGENSFAAVHGDNPVPPHHYIASYLWTRYGFGADAMIHFGTHGSLEFIPGKQVALSTADWSDRLVGDLPHFYLYTIGDVGEGIIAKRRSYATTVSHLTPPFIETEMRGEVGRLLEQIQNYLSKEEDDRSQQENLKIKELSLRMGLHRDLKLDSVKTQPYTDEEIERIENFAEELCSEKITGGMYTLGVAFSPEKINSSVELLATDPIAYGLAALDKLNGKITQKQIDNTAFFNRRYRTPAQAAVKSLLARAALSPDAVLARLGISDSQLARARHIRELSKPKDRMAMLKAMRTGKDSTGKHPDRKAMQEAMKKMDPKQAEKVKQMMAAMKAARTDTVTAADKEFADAVMNIADAVANVRNYKAALEQSPSVELESFINALNGGYVAPTPGGDYIANPNTLPTGRNLYSINAEATPSPAAWEKGVAMGEQMLADYLKNHGGNYPQKVSFTLWSGAFIESEGATIAQILWMLGAEPIRDQFGRVMDIRLVPASEMNRPRIDVVVQTSGQLRDLAASRLALIQKAIGMAAADDDGGENYVAKGQVDAEKVLLEKGFSPKEARELSTRRIFGGLNGMAGTGITGMVESGDRWENEREIADTYLNNMGAVYGSSEEWGDFKAGVFEAALQNTDAVVQPRQSNTWGALSLDHVYEFMGGMNLTVRNVTGKDPDTYFNDLRNRHHARVQELKEAIGVESRTTIFNPVYIKEQMKGGASSANNFTEIVRNTYGWNVMKPAAIDKEIWDRIYDIYVEDDLNLGTREFFDRENPAALQEMTAVMMETARKGYWKATPEQLKAIAELHSEMVTEHEAACSGFTCDNAKLRDFIGRQLAPEKAQSYKASVNRAISAAPSDNADNKGMVLEKEQLNGTAETEKPFRGLGIALGAFGVICAAVAVMLVLRKVRKHKA